MLSLTNPCELASLPFTLTADLQSKPSDDFLSFTRYFLDIITDAGRELLEFQCFLHPAVALDSLIESDGVKHNKGDDLMGLQCLLLLKPFCNFHYQKKSLLKHYSFYFPNASCKQRGRKCSPHQLCQANLERNEVLILCEAPLKCSSFLNDERTKGHCSFTM